MKRKVAPEPALLVAEVRQWRNVREFPDYDISNDGRLRRATDGSNTKRGTLIRVTMSPSKGSYPKYGLTSPSGRRVHRSAHQLVAAEFLPPQPPGRPLVLHSDDNRLNCVDTNLRWGTPAENTADAAANNRLSLGENHPSAKKPWTRPRGERHASAKLSERDVIAIVADGRLHREIASQYRIDKALVGRIKRGEVWKHITNPQYREMLEAGCTA